MFNLQYSAIQNQTYKLLIKNLPYPAPPHYANMAVQYTAIFHGCKNDNFQMKIFDICLIFAQNIDCGYSLEPTSTHNLCFGAKIRKNVYPCKPQLYYIKVGCKGVFVTRTCFRDDNNQATGDRHDDCLSLRL